MKVSIICTNYNKGIGYERLWIAFSIRERLLISRLLSLMMLQQIIRKEIIQDYQNKFPEKLELFVMK